MMILTSSNQSRSNKQKELFKNVHLIAEGPELLYKVLHDYDFLSKTVTFFLRLIFSVAMDSITGDIKEKRITRNQYTNHIQTIEEKQT